MKVKASLNNLRTSPRKVRLVTNSIVGMNCKAALVHLQHTVKKTSDPVWKLLSSAIANAENNFGLDVENLYVQGVQVGEGAKLKRWLPRAHGRATLLLKRTSHIDLLLEEKVEGKNRKTKEEMEKEKKNREDAKAKMIAEQEKAMKEDDDKQESEDVVKTQAKKVKPKKKVEAVKGVSQDKGFMSKVFQRKTGA